MRGQRLAKKWVVHVVLFAAVLLLATLAEAQTGNIAGTVKDSSGAVMPGVTVEASSTALIEKVRSVVTDTAGQYKIVELPPDLYRVNFSLAGFVGLALENIQLTSGFTATANAEMKVGQVSETITVSGLSPVVDVQNVTTQQVISREAMDMVPTGKFYADFGALIPGMTLTSTGASSQDVGGSVGNGLQKMAIHGGSSSDQTEQVNGMSITGAHISQGAYSFMTIPDSDIEETNMTFGSQPAEVEAGGVLINLIPKAGSNVFRGGVFANYGNRKLQSQNVGADLQAQSVPNNQGIKELALFNPSLGGPIMKDKVWFFSGYEFLRRVNFVNSHFIKTTRHPSCIRPTEAAKQCLIKSGRGVRRRA